MSDLVSIAHIDRLAGRRLGRFDVACPVCGPFRRTTLNRKRAVLRIWRDEIGVARFHCARCGSRGCARDSDQTITRAEEFEATRAEIAVRDANSEARRTFAALNLWQEAIDPAGSLVEGYLASRGLRAGEAAGHVIRFHPKLSYSGRRVPGMIALFREISSNAPVAIHRTFLNRRGEKIDRRMLGPVKNAAIKLTPDEDVTVGVGLAEGVETGLALLGSGWRPIWALGSAGGVERFPLLPAIETINVFADHDEAGMTAARICTRRWAEAGREARILAPPLFDSDWNDIGRRA